VLSNERGTLTDPNAIAVLQGGRHELAQGILLGHEGAREEACGSSRRGMR